MFGVIADILVVLITGLILMVAVIGYYMLDDDKD